MNSLRMKGLVKESAGAGAVLRTDLEVPQAGSREVLIKVHAAAVCGTDRHIYEWNAWAAQRVPRPMVFGHEAAGEIVAVGENVSEYKIGDRVAVETHIPCGHCEQCRTGNAHNCENMSIIGVHKRGCFSEYAVVPQECLWKLDDAVSYRHGSMLEPMGVAVHGVMSGPVAMRNVVILGCGPIGIMAAGAAAAAGAAKVMAADIFGPKLEMAKTVGADVCINTRETDLVQKVLEETGGSGADVIIDYTGNAKLIEIAFDALKKDGRFTLVGLPSEKLSLDATKAIIYKEARVNGVTGRIMYDTWYQCEKILKKGTFSLDSIIGGVYRLEEFEKAFSDIDKGVPGKLLFNFE